MQLSPNVLLQNRYPIEQMTMAQITLPPYSAPEYTDLRSQLHVVLPCYNEEGNLPALVSRIYHAMPAGLPCEVIAVDDGSSDRTVATILTLSETFHGVSLLRHAINQGMGIAIRTGIRRAVEVSSPNDLIVVMDADNTHDPALIPEMARRLSNGYDIIVASRYVKGGQQTGLAPYRVVLSKVLNLLIRLITRLPVRDATSGYRGYRASLLRVMLDTNGGNLVDSRGFEASLEILARAYMCGGRISEIPLQLEYDRKVGVSKMHLVRTITGYIVLFSRILSWRASTLNRGH